MLTRLAVKNFRLLRDVTIDVEPGKPIVLIGPNSSGKSSVLQVLDVLRRCATEGAVDLLKVFGGVNGVMQPQKNGMGLTIDVDLSAPNQCHDLYELTLSLQGLPEREKLVRRGPGDQHGEKILLERRSSRISVWNELAKQVEQYNDDLFDELAFHTFKLPYAYPGLDALRRSLFSIQIYDGFLVTPLWARDPREGLLSPFDSTVLSPTPRIDRRGLSLVNALYHLHSNHEDAWHELFSSFQAEFPFVTRLEFPADPAGGRIALGWRDRRYPGVRMQGHQMSGGMAAYLCLLAAILSPEPTPVIAFDEPDTQLHPSALRRVVHLLEEAAKRTTVIVATHSDRFLDHLSDPAASLRLCEPSESGVTIHRVDRDALEAWRSDYTMSELRERGHLDPPNSEGGASS